MDKSINGSFQWINGERSNKRLNDERLLNGETHHLGKLRMAYYHGTVEA
jgi:hypothetical protein